jgi:two-component system LytT family response regulator
MITAILVDDMPKALDVLEADIRSNFKDIQILGKADSVVSAAKLLREKRPDILFLDIMLGDGTGFDLLEIYPDLESKVIFVTASEEFALRAFRFAAVDYLLKPIDVDELKEAVAKASRNVDSQKDRYAILSEAIREPRGLPSKISLHTLERIAVVEVNDIVRCEADGNNTLFHLVNGERIFVTKTLKYFERLLEGHPFHRVHQSHLIHLNYIREYVKKEGGYIKMKNDDIVPVAVRKKAAVIKLLDNLQ